MRWPVRAAPVIAMAGRSPLDRTAFDFVYCCPTHALHLHDYDGAIRMDSREFPLAPGVVTLSVARGHTSYDLPNRGHHWCVHFQPLPVRGETMLLPWHLPVGPHREFVADRMRQYRSVV